MRYPLSRKDLEENNEALRKAVVLLLARLDTIDTKTIQLANAIGVIREDLTNIKTKLGI